MGLNVEKVREDFPILNNDKKSIVYFDNSCMTLRPRQVVETMNKYYYEYPACAGRSMHKLGNKITDEVAIARKNIRKFINAKSDEELIFTKNTTESINLIANSFNFKEGDKILITDKEHNSNLLPWQIIAKKKKLILDVVNSNSDNTFDMSEFEKKVEGAKFVSMVHTSNLDGVTNPANEIIKKAHKEGSLVMLDAAQSAPHKEVDVKKLGADFIAFSGHKMLGPSGIGAMYGKKKLLLELNPFLVGGETVKNTTFTDQTWEDLPNRFEAGLQNYAGILGFSEAVNYLKRIGLKNIEKHELKLTKQLSDGLSEIKETSIIGPDSELRGGITSFNLNHYDPHQIALLMDNSANVMLRSGAHCVHSWFNKHKLEGSIRASLYFYNTEEEVEYFIDKLKKVRSLL